MKVLVAMMFIIVSRLWQAESNRLTAFKTISMRIRGAKSEMSELGLDTEGMVESTAKLREEIMALSGVDIMLNNNEFKTTYQIMEELAAKWQDLSDIQQATVTELIAGKRQGNIVSSLMNNFDIAQKALETSLNSSGSAMAEHAKWQQSLEAQILKLKAAWQSLSQSFMSSNFLKGALDAVIGLVDGITTLIDTFGTIPTLVGAFAAFESFQGVGFFNTIKDEATGAATGITSAFSRIKDAIDNVKNDTTISFDTGFTQSLADDETALMRYKLALNSGMSAQEAFNATMQNASPIAQQYARTVQITGESVQKFTDQQKMAELSMKAQDKSWSNCSALINSYNKSMQTCGLTQEQFLKSIQASNPALHKYLSGLGDANGTFKGYIASLISAKVATFALEAATLALNAAITMGISALISWGISKLDELIETADELSERIDEVVSKFNSQQKELVKNKSSFTSDAERYIELSKGVDSLGRNLSLTTEEYSEYQNVVNSVAGQIPSLVSGYDSQGNAILNVKGNVEELVAAYEKLIEVQNNKVIASAGDIQKDFKNSVKYADTASVFNDRLITKDVTALKEALDNNAISSQEVYEIINKNGAVRTDIVNALEKAGLENDLNLFSTVEDYDAFIADAVKNHPDIVKSIVRDFELNIETETAGMKSIADAVLSNAFDISSSDYYGMNDTLKNVAKQVVNSFDYEFFKGLDADGKDVGIYVNDMLAQLNSINDSDIASIDAAFNLRTQFNGGEISYGEYVDGLKNAGELINELGLEPEIASQIKLSIGLSEKDGEWSVAEYDNLLNRLTHDDFEFQLDVKSAESFLKNLSSEELNVTIGFIDDKNKDFNSALQNYKNILNEAEQAGVDFSKTVYGNIDTNARQVLEWNSENLKKYKDELMSWEPEGVSWDNVKKGYEGAISTVMGTLSSYEIDGKEVDIAFSPMLQTDNGAEVLSSGTVDTYINELISKATEDGKWDNAELFALDATGLEVDGQKIKGILADIGETAQATSEQMHFVGKDGALALAESDIFAMIEHQARINEALNFKADISVDTAALETLNTVLSESASAIGLTSESISALKSKYKDFETYDPAALFEATANGVKVNQEEVARLEKEHQKLTKSKVKEHLETLVDAYNDNVKAMDECSNASERARLISENETYKSRIEELAQYQAQLEGVTGAYKRWLDAQNTPEDYEGYEAIAKGWETVEDELSRGFLGKASKEYIDLLSGEDLRGADIDAYAAAWGRLDDKVTSTGYSVKDFFTLDDDGNITSTGIHRFFESIKESYDGVIYKQDEFGNAIYDFSSKNLEAIQRDWGISIEAIGLLLEGAVAAGYNVDWGGILDSIDLDTATFETVLEYAEAAQKAFNELDGIDDIDFNFKTTNVEDATSELEKAQQIYKDLIKNDDGSINLDAEGAEEMRVVLAALTLQKQQLERPAIMDIKVSSEQAETDIGKATKAVQDLQNKLEELEQSVYNPEINSSEITQDINEIINKLKALEQTDPQIYAKLGLDNTEIANLKSVIGSIQTKIKTNVDLEQSDINALKSALQGIDVETVVNYLLGEQDAAEDKNALVNYDLGTQAEPIDKNANVNYILGSQASPKAMTAVVNYVNQALGTAHAGGTTSGNAFARGNWGINGNGVALGGELGQELVVRDGKFFTIGDTGAEFFRYKKNDIVFNAAQTESLFKYGGIKGAKPRGTMLAGGTAFANGNAFAEGRAFAYKAKVDDSDFAKKNSISAIVKDTSESIAEAVKGSVSSGKGSGKGSGGGGSGGGNGGDSSSSDDKDFFDWIEILIDRIERAIDRFEQKANNVFDSWENRGDALNKQSDLIRHEIEKQQEAYDYYLQYANSLVISSDSKKDAEYKERIQNGTIKISQYTGDDREKLENYKQFYDKALDCKDAIEELKEAESELYKQRLDNVVTRYEGILGVIEHEKNMLEEYINQSEEQAWLASREYYNALADNERENVAELEAQKAEMLNAFNEAMDSGTIAEGSEAYYEMVASIDEVTLAITESHTALLEYEQTLQQLNWEVFDLLQDKISSVTDETEFLIELLSSDKLFDDNGQLTDSGMATMGQHGVAYNAYMHQADLAAAEAAKLKAELEKDPYDTELEERYREMISLQQKYILSAQGEKEAIRDLVEEGIGLELETLQELIDKKNEALESERDLYEYQKKVKEQTEEIASLEKQMAAYSGDDSEEAKQKIQKIKVDLESARQDLEETEYDKFIDDSSAMFDELYLEYETILNTRLDNIDALLEDMIEEINLNAIDISNTLSEKADSVGYTLSDSMAEIWDKNSVSTQNVITAYSEKFITAQTTTNNALDSINIKLQDMINKLNEKATANVKSASTSSVAKSTATKSTTTTTTTTKKSTSGGDGTPKIGDKVKFVNGQYYYDSYGMRPLGSQKQGQYVYITNINNRSGATHPYHISTGTKLGSGDLGWLKLNQITGYATGKKNFPNDEIAWTQEGATEFIVRPSDGAILTPIAKRDSVLTSAASRNIWDMANSPAEFIKNNLDFGSAGVPNNSNVQNNYTQHLEKVVISFPNVKNYDEVLSALRDDKSFEKLVHSMTIDRIAGKSSLAKGKSIR